jgi:Zn-dependent protease
METLFVIALLILSVVIHEVSHGYAALWLGDRTALYAGRLTLNPIKHLDPIGSVLVPILVSLLPGNFFFGWAKPVPFNPYNLRNQRWGEAIVAFAGPLSNIILAILFGIILRYAEPLNLNAAFIEISVYITLINIGLAIFNLIPIPPLDGSKILFSILPYQLWQYRAAIEQYSLFLIVIFVFFFSSWLGPVVAWLFQLVTGLTL